MKKVNFFSILLLFLFFITSCSEDFMNNQSDKHSFKLVCNKVGQDNWTKTKAAVGEDGSGSFQENDVIGVVVSDGSTSQYVELTYQGGEWFPGLDFSEFQGNSIVISAHYPLLQTPTVQGESADYSLPLVQTEQAGFNMADLLFASVTVNLDATSAVLDFNHAMHRLDLNLTGTVSSNMNVKVRTLADASFSLVNGTFEVDSEAGYEWVEPYKNADGSYSAIIIPQATTPYQEESGLIAFQSGSKSSVYVLPSKSELANFEAGKKTSINLTVNEESGGVTDDFSNSIHWVYGVNAPDFPGLENVENVYTYFGMTDAPAGEWLRIDLFDNEYQYLTWKEGCGWYDCNKTSEYIDDANLCWAAVASNMIHWWMYHNQKYIDAYDTEFGKEYNDYERPSSVFVPMTSENQNHSEIFNFFKAYYLDKTGWTASGVNWFLNGEPSYPISNTAVGFNGFFRSLFTPDDVITEYYKGLNKTKFNQRMKEAFNNDMALGFVVADFGGIGTGLHGMTIWGAEFDEEGNVSYIYFCDNNTPDSDPNMCAIQRYKIIYNESSDLGAYDEYVYMRMPENKDGVLKGRTYLLSALFLTDLRLDIWKAKYPNL